jgi:DNA-binding SARP family transcriptional activator
MHSNLATVDVVQQPICLSMIGDFQLRCAAESVTVAPSSQRVICFLALQGGPVRRSYVSGSLWFDATESRACASLRSALWRIPNAARKEVVHGSSTHIWLNPDVDVDLRRVVALAHAVLKHDSAGETVLDVTQELCMFADDLLVGWCDDWVILERERLRQLRLHALDLLGEQLLSAGRYSDALEVGFAAVAAEPLRESAHRLLVRTHLRESNCAEALRQYRSYASMLRDELAISPSETMVALVRDYLDPS